MARGDCTIARGNARRAQMMEVLRDHPEGMRSDAIAEAVGLSHSMGRYHTRMMGCLMRGWGPWVMYFHPDHLAEADAYAASLVKLDHSVSAEKERRILEFILSRARSSKADICEAIGIHPEVLTGVLTALVKADRIGKSSEGGHGYWHKPGVSIKKPRVSARSRILELLGQHVSLHRERLCRILDLSEKRAGEALYELSQEGKVVGIKDGVGRENNRRAWCLPEHAEKVREQAAQALRDQLRVRTQPKKQGPIGPTVCNVELVVLPGFTGRTFRSENPEPLFSSLKPGQYPSQPTTAYARTL